VDATYEYDAFGNILRATGPATAWNNFTFSTKYLDQETGWSYYGYRYYDALRGRWPSRDPIEERGGVNLYSIVDNDVTNVTDFLGLQTAPTPPAPGQAANLGAIADLINWLTEPSEADMIKKCSAKRKRFKDHSGPGGVSEQHCVPVTKYCCVIALLYTNPTAGTIGKGRALFSSWSADVVHKACDEAKNDPSFVPGDRTLRQQFFDW
jgi:RHS repeat-associated protein